MDVNRRGLPGELAQLRGLALVAVLFLSFSFSTAVATEQTESRSPSCAVVSRDTLPSGSPCLKAKILIRAPLDVVWRTVHEQRKLDPDLAYSKVLQEEGNNSLLEQRFILLPVIGATTCVMNNSEVPMQRIDYKLMKSDRFKAMEGSWVFTALDSKSTVLELSSYLDLGIPGTRGLLDAVTTKKLQRRVARIKDMSEATFLCSGQQDTQATAAVKRRPL